jgi:NADPH-dependent 7-cyano-7-deazaguanine reductase QueF-like protein
MYNLIYGPQRYELEETNADTVLMYLIGATDGKPVLTDPDLRLRSDSSMIHNGKSFKFYGNFQFFALAESEDKYITPETAYVILCEAIKMAHSVAF